MIRCLLLAASFLVLSNAGSVRLQAALTELSTEDQRYLNRLFSDTWNYIDHFVNEDTGFPYDSHQRTPSTSLTNIGFYMASCAVAAKSGLISEEAALNKLRKVLKGLDRVEKWRGFPVTWVDARNLQTIDRQFSTVDHLGNLSASLILVRNVFPELKKHVDEILSPMNWRVLYEPRNHFYKGGYRLDLKDFDIEQSWGEWYYNFLGADTRLGSFIGVAKKEVPLEHWKALNRDKERKYGREYYVPGWQGGGLFMQFISGLFLDERDTVLGRSAADFAYAQIIHAGRIGSPVWGWSAAVAPGGKYLGWGAIRDEVSTPHASAMAISYYPRRTVANLRNFERLGARPPFIEDGKYLQFGFRDSIDWKSGRVSEGYLLLDQTMLFLSLANFLHGGVVWKHFRRDPVARNGLETIPEYADRHSDYLAIYSRRDNSISLDKKEAAGAEAR